jgi:DNA-binding response OmpR family regulator
LTFIITFKPPMNNTPAPKRILLVDDHPQLLRELTLVLTESGEYEILTALDGDEALAILHSQPVDMIVADIGMPRMSGYELYEHVRANPARPQWAIVPFVFLSGRSLASDIRYGKALGADDYLTKPVKPEDLLAVIRGKLRHQQGLRRLIEPPAVMALTIGGHQFRFDRRQYRLWIDEVEIGLSGKEALLLSCLVQRPNQVVSPMEVAAVTHGLALEEPEAGLLVRPHIKRLRRKLQGPLGGLDCLKNLRGRGYMLLADG